MSVQSAFASWLNNHKLVRRLSLLWAVALITAVTYKVFWHPVAIPMGTVTAYGTTVGILTIVIGFYQWTRHKEDQQQ